MVPAGGEVAIAIEPAGSAPTGFSFLGKQVDITAPAASAAQPLALTFVVDASLVGSLPAAAVQVFRTEGGGASTEVADCTAADGTATPDPCVSGRTLLGSGDVRVTVLTSTASLWDLGYQLDRTPPTVSVTRPVDGASYVLGSVVRASYSCSDTGSGLASCTGTVANGGAISTTTVGLKTFTITATDRVGNQTVKSVSYRVVYAFAGFLAPVGSPPTLNTTRGGGAVPFKFGLGGNFGLSILSGTPTSAPINCSTHATTGVAVAASGSLTYDKSASRYTYTWQTVKSWVGTCRAFTLVLNDGTPHTALFKFGS
jgi:hypothetical protein